MNKDDVIIRNLDYKNRLYIPFDKLAKMGIEKFSAVAIFVENGCLIVKPIYKDGI